MENFWMNFAVEIGFFGFLGALYYFYQRKKILHYEAHKTPMVMEFILQSCLNERETLTNVELDALIEAIDDYLQHKSPSPPILLLEHFVQTQTCSLELKAIIQEGLTEIENK